MLVDACAGLFVGIACLWWREPWLLANNHYFRGSFSVLALQHLLGEFRVEAAQLLDYTLTVELNQPVFLHERMA